VKPLPENLASKDIKKNYKIIEKDKKNEKSFPGYLSNLQVYQIST